MISIDKEGQQIWGKGQGVATLVNIDPSNPLYIEYGTGKPDLSSDIIPPLGTITVDGTSSIQAATLQKGVSVSLQAMPGVTQWTPSPQEIIAAIEGISVSPNTIFPSGDQSGTIDTPKFAAILGAGGSPVLTPNSSYYVTAGSLILKPGAVLPQEIFGNGAAIYQVGAAGATIIIESTGAINNNVRCGLHDLQVRGDLSAAGAVGIQLGDVEQIALDNVSVLKFTSGPGFHFLNSVGWTEQTHGDIYIDNCQVGVLFEGGASNSFDRMDLRAWFNQQGNQTGVRFKGGGQCTHGSLQIRGNFAAIAANTGIVLDFSDAGCNFNGGRLDIAVEQGGAAGSGHKTINFFAGSNFIKQCFGQLIFLNGTVSFQASNNNFNVGPFNGYIYGDGTLADSDGQYDQHINSGFPAGITGNIYIKQMAEADLAFITFNLFIANGTNVNFGDNWGTIAPPLQPSGNLKEIVGVIDTPASSTGVFGCISLGFAGAIQYGGTSFVQVNNGIFAGQSLYSLSL